MSVCGTSCSCRRIYIYLLLNESLCFEFTTQSMLFPLLGSEAGILKFGNQDYSSLQLVESVSTLYQWLRSNMDIYFMTLLGLFGSYF